LIFRKLCPVFVCIGLSEYFNAQYITGSKPTRLSPQPFAKRIAPKAHHLRILIAPGKDQTGVDEVPTNAKRRHACSASVSATRDHGSLKHSDFPSAEN
jgi:hypothetical protein